MNRRAITAAVGVGLLFAGVAVWVGAQGYTDDQTVRYDRESRYYRVQVVDYPTEGRRCLHFSKSRGIQSSMILADPCKLDLRYSRSIMAFLALHPDPKDVLVVGLGGGSIPKFIRKHFPEIRIDVVEIDPDVAKVCQEFFEFKPSPTMRVIAMDGRMFLKRSQKQYDAILLDAYAADRIPFHLTTREFIELVKSRLKPGGLVASNLWEHTINRFYTSELATYKSVFPQTYRFKAGTSGNIILFATLDDKEKPKADWVERAKALAKGRDFGFDLPQLVGDEYECLTPRRIDEEPLTDDMAPVDTLRHENPKYFDAD